MVKGAIKALKERNGSSVQAIKKYIQSNHTVDIEKLTPFIRKYLKSGVVKGELLQAKGKGASGSFKLNKAVSSGETKKPKKVVKPKESKPKTSKSKSEKSSISKSEKKAKKEKSIKKSSTPKKTKPSFEKASKKSSTPKSIKSSKPKAEKKKVAESKAKSSKSPKKTATKKPKK
uniref:Histone H1-II n=1 Tax=Sarcoptes scabiei TaxID=52283 RepID=A0A834RG94_SARSC